MAATTVADYLLERLRDWGVDDGVRLPGRRHQRHSRCLGPGREQPEVHPVPARGDERVRGGRLREVHRPLRRLHGHLGPWRRAPAQWPVRRQARPRPGRRDRRARPAGRRWGAPTSRKWTCSACSRTSPASTCRWSPFPSSCPTCWTGPSASRSPSARRPRSSSPPTSRNSSIRRRRTRSRWCRPASGVDWPTAIPGDAAIAPRRRDPQRRPEGRHPGGLGRARRARGT